MSFFTVITHNGQLPKDGKEFTVTAETKEGKPVDFTGDQLLVAVGVKPNSDTLAVEKAGIETTVDGSSGKLSELPHSRPGEYE